MIRRSKCPVHGANRRVPVVWALSEFEGCKASDLGLGADQRLPLERSFIEQYRALIELFRVFMDRNMDIPF